MILPLFDWLERREWLTRRTINGEPAHRFWWWHIGLAFKGEHHRYKGRPRTRALMIGEVLVYPLVWAGWLALCLLGAALTIPLRGLLGLPEAAIAILEGIAGPGYLPVLTRPRVLGWWMKYDPPEPQLRVLRVVEPVPVGMDPEGDPVALGDGICPNCRNGVDPTWVRCPYCGHRETMSTNRCAYCYGPLPADHPDAVHVVRLDGGEGGIVELRWHLVSSCAAADPLHTGALADALSMPDGPESDDATRLAYGAIRDRAATRDRDNPRLPPVLPQVVKIRRDTQSPTETLRGRGAAWGRLSPRPGVKRRV